MLKGTSTMIAALLVTTPVLHAAGDLDRELLSGTQNQMVMNCTPFRGTEKNVGKEMLIPDRFNPGICWGAFLYLGTIIQVKNENKQPLLAICAPQEVSVNHLIAKFLTYADEHPEMGDKSFAYSAQKALLDSYPCAGRTMIIGQGR
jgi:hypothetical protein